MDAGGARSSSDSNTLTLPGLAILELRLLDATGHVHHRNFVSFVVKGATPDVVANESSPAICSRRVHRR